ncbi:MAG TPA: hypothetical protein VJU59_44985 [Paraburkholderia sp.]|uniref:hypothetical protein n=1 Tax=Paraburkholderia sp. TaxID=1926495 RepID=UPI002B463510|nr:hypothetical protein [Paraburkholderia sp.]HKR46747.1 hypothetical protein [Paraburkholderia sp.]
MYHNLHAEELALLEREENRLRRDIFSAQAQLERFEDFDREGTHSRLSNLKRAARMGRERLDEIARTIESNAAQLVAARKAASPGVLDFFYVSSERSVATRQVAELEQRADKLGEERSKLTTDLGEIEASERSVAADLECFRGFNPLEIQAILAQLGTELRQAESRLDLARKASERWEAAAGEVVREYDEVNREIRAIETTLRLAQALQRDLEAALTPKERARIHGDCEVHFGVGNRRPGEVLKEATSRHRKLKRDAEKLQRRLEGIIQVLDKKITKLVLDGNNLCYATTESGKRRFVGIEPLKALVSRLCETYTVELLFDPGIKRQTQMKDSDLRALFPEVRVEVMAHDKADLAILAAAEFDEHAYVVSNDRFADFPDKDAVKNKRIFGHIIHPQSVQIPALDLNIRYRHEQAPS